MPDGLQVSGGADGSAARVDDMRTYAGVADRIGEHLEDAARQLTALTVSAEVASTTPLSPMTAARAQSQAVQATGQLYSSLALVKARATRLRLTADAIEAADVATSIGTKLRTTGLGFLGLGAGIHNSVFTAPFRYVDNLGGATGDAVSAGRESGWRAFFAALANAPGDAGRQTVSDIGAMWSGLLLDRPEMTNAVVDSLGAVASLLHGRFLSYPETVSSVIAIGERFGLLDDHRRVEVLPGPFGDMDATTKRNILVPTSLEDLVLNQASLMDLAKADEDSSRLRVIEVPSATGSSWIVQVPGTQELDGGTNPSDMITNLYLSGPQDAALLDAIDDVLRAHGVGDDPIMLVGHSQGGIAAANFSGQADDRGYNVTHAFTVGSPIATIEVPDNVQLLAIEHTNDPVPRLDAQDNPDRANLTTVVADLGGSTEFDSPIDPHGSDVYRETAGKVDASDDPSIQHFLDSAQPFLAGPGSRGDGAISSGQITDHVIQREQP